MRGIKGSEYEGGHRTPLFLHFPAAGLNIGRDVTQLTANIDVLPTLMDMCDIKDAEGVDFHGVSVKPLIMGKDEDWEDRVVVTDSQRVEYPIKWRKSAVMNNRWRLINGVELYDILADPEQRNDLAKDHPDLVQELREYYEEWWSLVSASFDDPCPIIIGSEHEKISRITTHDWHGDQCAWNQGQIRQGLECNGYWVIEVAQDGEYEFELRRWPKEEDKNMTQCIPGEITDWYHGGRAIDLRVAQMKIAHQEQTQEIDPEAKGVKFVFNLKAGLTQMQTYLTDAEGKSIGSYFVYSRKLD
jgi:hypothetical protein